jgi:hypothetical protein
MQQRPPWLLAAVGVAVFFLLSTRNEQPGPLGPKPDGPDLVAVFRATSEDKATARKDALSFGVLCEAIASMIEYDGRRGEQARLLTASQLDDLRRWSREYYLRGQSYNTRYPQLGEVAGAFLDSKLGTAGGPIDDSCRTRWIEAYRQLAKCSLYAAENLE